MIPSSRRKRRSNFAFIFPFSSAPRVAPDGVRVRLVPKKHMCSGLTQCAVWFSMLVHYLASHVGGYVQPDSSALFGEVVALAASFSMPVNAVATSVYRALRRMRFPFGVRDIATMSKAARFRIAATSPQFFIGRDRVRAALAADEVSMVLPYQEWRSTSIFAQLVANYSSVDEGPRNPMQISRIFFCSVYVYYCFDWFLLDAYIIKLSRDAHVRCQLT